MDFEYRFQGQSVRVSLADGEHLVGRSLEAALVIPAPQVSSRHARLRIAGDRLFVRDLGSKNGTEVGGRTLSPEQGEIEVKPNQELHVASIEIERVRSAPRVETTESDSMTRMSFPIEGGYKESARVRIAAELSSLFELIAADDGPEALADRACEFVSGVVRADRVVLLEDNGEGSAPLPRGSWCSSGEATEDLRLSQTLLDRVIDDRTSLMFQSIDGGGGESASIVALGIRSAIAAPLFDNERVRGILYVDSLGNMDSYSEDDLQLVTATANAVGVRLRNITMEKEQATAAEIQKSLLPKTLPPIPGHELHVHIEMCRAVGGDLYQVLPYADGRVLLALGDVTGKGMPAALVMSACMVLIATLAEICGSVEEIVGHLHRQLFKVLTPTQFVTLFLADLDPATGALTYVNAGHEPPLLIGADGAIRELPPTLLPLAMMPDCRPTVAQASLAAGDLLAVFSDGIPEATLDGENFLGLDPARQVLTAHHGRPLETLQEDIDGQVREFLGGSRPSDDISLMLLRREDA